eukprot:TRINITY_DN6392_c2_g4_i1.p1 TRINITY_DN6392_c2_g4~~TRINITY_DN6392_c2_g4_i1.p1  ORF type:complete len:535 (-),score=70.44 TRINITY_DN6392_c2_g4_i1:120-1724(-)
MASASARSHPYRLLRLACLLLGSCYLATRLQSARARRTAVNVLNRSRHASGGYADNSFNEQVPHGAVFNRSRFLNRSRQYPVGDVAPTIQHTLSSQSAPSIQHTLESHSDPSISDALRSSETASNLSSITAPQMYFPSFSGVHDPEHPGLNFLHAHVPHEHLQPVREDVVEDGNDDKVEHEAGEEEEEKEEEEEQEEEERIPPKAETLIRKFAYEVLRRPMSPADVSERYPPTRNFFTGNFEVHYLRTPDRFQDDLLDLEDLEEATLKQICGGKSGSPLYRIEGTALLIKENDMTTGYFDMADVVSLYRELSKQDYDVQDLIVPNVWIYRRLEDSTFYIIMPNLNMLSESSWQWDLKGTWADGKALFSRTRAGWESGDTVTVTWKDTIFRFLRDDSILKTTWKAVSFLSRMDSTDYSLVVIGAPDLVPFPGCNCEDSILDMSVERTGFGSQGDETVRGRFLIRIMGVGKTWRKWRQVKGRIASFFSARMFSTVTDAPTYARYFLSSLEHFTVGPSEKSEEWELSRSFLEANGLS